MIRDTLTLEGLILTITLLQDATHTTYNVKCDSEATLCSLPATGVAVVTGPSYVGLSYTEPSETL